MNMELAKTLAISAIAFTVGLLAVATMHLSVTQAERNILDRADQERFQHCNDLCFPGPWMSSHSDGRCFCPQADGDGIRK